MNKMNKMKLEMMMTELKKYYPDAYSSTMVTFEMLMEYGVITPREYRNILEIHDNLRDNDTVHNIEI